MEPTHTTEPRFYIIMRRDLWDNTPGKMMAQAAHAQSDFDYHLFPADVPNYHEFSEAVRLWREDRSFGVTLVLHEPLSVMEEIRNRIPHSGMTVDPTYPYRNYYGEMFVREEITCMWAFVWTDEEVEYMKQFNLHQ